MSNTRDDGPSGSDQGEFDQEDEWEEPSDPTIPLTPSHRMRPSKITGPAERRANELRGLGDVTIDAPELSADEEEVDDEDLEVTSETRPLVRPTKR